MLSIIFVVEYILNKTTAGFGHGLQGGPTLAFSLRLSDFKTKTSFGFLIKESEVVFLFFRKVEKCAHTTKKHVFGDFSENSIVLQ